MPEPIAPPPFDAAFAARLLSTKDAFIEEHEGNADESNADEGELIGIAQPGAAAIDHHGWPGWPDLAGQTASSGVREAIIETYVATPAGADPTSAYEPFVSAWQPLAAWMNTVVRSALRSVGAQIEDPAYITASITPSDELEGSPHLDDAVFSPTENVGLVAIIGQFVGTRAAIGVLPHARLHAGQFVDFDPEILASFGRGGEQHCVARGDQLVVLPQFGQLHVGPKASEVTMSPTRQLLVMRAGLTRLPAMPR